MTFGQPAALALMLLLPVLAIFLIWRESRRRTALHKLGDPQLVMLLMAQVSPVRRIWRAALWLATVASVIFALAQPRWGITAEVIQTAGAQIVFAIDVSRSMDAQDTIPSRLERAKLHTTNLLSTIPGNDAAIVLFAGDAFTYLPLTYDLDTAAIFLAAVNTDAISRQGTDLSAAIERAILSFDTRYPAGRAVVLLSDGENHEGDAKRIARLAAAEGIIIHTVAYGTPQGAVIPVYDESGNLIDYKTTEDGILVETRRNDALLRSVAEETDGIYLDGHMLAALDPISNSLNELSNVNGRDQVIVRPVERFGLFVGLALLTLGISVLIPETRQNLT